MSYARIPQPNSLLNRVSNPFLPPEMRPSGSAQIRRQRIFIISNLCGPVLVGVITLTIWLVTGLLDPNAPVSLASTSLSIVWVSCIRLGVPYERLIVLPLLHFIGITAWFSWIDGGLTSSSIPWLVVMPVICIFFATGWQRYVGLLAIMGCITAMVVASLNGYQFPSVTPLEQRPVIMGISAIFAAIYLAVMCSVMTALNENHETRLGDMANRDALTNSLNRRGLEKAFKALNPGNHCLVVVDIDHFKAVNDRYGHHGGDKLLRLFTQKLQQSLRQEDYVARIGGEEFAIIISHTNLEKGYEIIERIRCDIAKDLFPISEQQTGERVTFSAGIISISPRQSIDTQLRQADELLYQAKHAGRNQVCREQTRPANETYLATS